MEENILSRLSVKKGHFLLESGYHTDSWFDLDDLFLNPVAITSDVIRLSNQLRPYNVTAICEPMSGGAFLAHSLASELNSKFYYTQKISDNNSVELFKAEYGLPNGLKQKISGEKVAVVDDMISAGSSVRATIKALAAAGAETVVVGCFFLVGDLAKIYFATSNMPVEALVQQSFNFWASENCSFSKQGMKLENPVSKIVS